MAFFTQLIARVSQPVLSLVAEVAKPFSQGDTAVTMSTQEIAKLAGKRSVITCQSRFHCG